LCTSLSNSEKASSRGAAVVSEGRSWDDFAQCCGGVVDQLFNSSKKRLARTLLLLARYGKEGATLGGTTAGSQSTTLC
jgi:hypothetical protein